MNIVVPIKQVPETGNVEMDPETGTMIRSGVEQIINPLDLYAIEEAIRLRDEYGGEVTTISMGPPTAEKALRESISMGCDNSVLLSDPDFAGADTWSTSYVLARAIENLDEVDLILCGERATDGDTGQVGPGIATWLDLPFMTYVSNIEEISENSLRVERNVEGGYQILELQRPSLLTVVKELNFPRLPTLEGKKRAKDVEIPVWGPEEINAEEENLGLDGSPTRVVDISTPQVARKGEKHVPDSDQEIEESVDRLIDYFEELEII